VRGPTTWTLLGVALVVALAAACARHPRPERPRLTTGTCDGACRHYMSCKGQDDQRVFDACVAECREIFMDGDDADRDSLRAYERLSCPDATAFVEGASGRGPGETRAGSGEKLSSE
jgi:hypothetical protein